MRSKSLFKKLLIPLIALVLLGLSVAPILISAENGDAENVELCHVLLEPEDGIRDEAGALHLANSLDRQQSPFPANPTVDSRHSLQ